MMWVKPANNCVMWKQASVRLSQAIKQLMMAMAAFACMGSVVDSQSIQAPLPFSAGQMSLSLLLRSQFTLKLYCIKPNQMTAMCVLAGSFIICTQSVKTLPPNYAV